MAWVRGWAAAGQTTHPTNNIGDWQRLCVGSAALLTGDRALFDRQVASWQTSVSSQIDANGLMPAEMKRTRSLWYHPYGLRPIVAFAELARRQGVDLYGTPAGQQVARVLENVGPSLVNPKLWKGQEIVPSKIQPSTSYALYQVAAARYPNRPAIRQVADALGTRLKTQPGWVAEQVKAGLQGGNNAGMPIPAGDAL